MSNGFKYAVLSLALASFVASCAGQTPSQTAAPVQAEVPGIDLDTLSSAAVGSDAYKVSQTLSALQGSLKKLDFSLAYLFSQRTSSLSGQSVASQKIVVDALAQPGQAQALLEQLSALGLEGGAAFGPVVSGRIPVSALEQAAALSSLKSVRASFAKTNAGLVTSQGDVAQKSDVLRTVDGLSGAGQTVGILSDTFSFYDTPGNGGPGNPITNQAQDIANGDLPAAGNITILEEGLDRGADEGRAMAQIVHDVAPGAKIQFHSAFNGLANFAQGILDLKAAGSTVIVDDVFYFAEPYFQDGVIAQAANQVKNEGVPYFSAAGNQGIDSYESSGTWRSTFRKVNKETTYDFSGSNDPSLGVTLQPGELVIAVLQWDQPFASVAPTVPGGIATSSPGSASDLNFYLTNANGSYVMPPLLYPINPNNDWLNGNILFPPLFPTVSMDNNLGGDAVELVAYINTLPTPLNVGFAVTHKSGPLPGKFKINYYGGTLNEYTANRRGTVVGHANAAGAFATGAARYSQTPAFGQTPPLLESFSSVGGVSLLFDANGTRKLSPELRAKPDAVAPQCADTTFFYYSLDLEPNGSPNFCGTSAAAPHAAGVAALLKQFQPSLTPDGLYNALKSTAINMDVPGYDIRTGAGLIQADAARGLFPRLIDFQDRGAGTVATYSKGNYRFSNILPSTGLPGNNLFFAATEQGYDSTVTMSNFFGDILQLERVVAGVNKPFDLLSFKYGTQNVAGAGDFVLKGYFSDNSTQSVNIAIPDQKTPLLTYTPNWTNLVKVEFNPQGGINNNINPALDDLLVQDR